MQIGYAFNFRLLCPCSLIQTMTQTKRCVAVCIQSVLAYCCPMLEYAICIVHVFRVFRSRSRGEQGKYFGVAPLFPLHLRLSFDLYFVRHIAGFPQVRRRLIMFSLKAGANCSLSHRINNNNEVPLLSGLYHPSLTSQLPAVLCPPPPTALFLPLFVATDRGNCTPQQQGGKNRGTATQSSDFGLPLLEEPFR